MDIKDVQVFKTKEGENDSSEPQKLEESMPAAGTARHLPNEYITQGGVRRWNLPNEDHQEAAKRHDIETARLSRSILTGSVAAVQQIGDIHYLVSIYDDQPVYIPFDQANLTRDPRAREEAMLRVANGMLGAEIDFIITEVKEGKIFGSREAAMSRRYATFYLGDNPLITKNQIAEARIISVARQAIRVELFGLMARIPVANLTRQYLADCRDRYAVGSRIFVYVDDVSGSSFQDASITVNAVSVETDRSKEEFDRVQIPGRYLGKVAFYRAGIYYIRLDIGANIVSHKCRTPVLPTVGDKVAVMVNYKNESTLEIRGIIVQLFGVGATI